MLHFRDVCSNFYYIYVRTFLNLGLDRMVDYLYIRHARAQQWDGYGLFMFDEIVVKAIDCG